MNDYTRVKFTVTPNEEVATDVLAALLADVGFESFVPEDDGVSAYVPQTLYDADAIAAVVAGVIEHTVQHHLDATLVSFVKNLLEKFVVTVIGRNISVV